MSAPPPELKTNKNLSEPVQKEVPLEPFQTAVSKEENEERENEESEESENEEVVNEESPNKERQNEESPNKERQNEERQNEERQNEERQNKESINGESTNEEVVNEGDLNEENSNKEEFVKPNVPTTLTNNNTNNQPKPINNSKMIQERGKQYQNNMIKSIKDFFTS